MISNLKKAQVITVDQADRTKWGTYPLMLQAYIEGDMATFVNDPAGERWLGNKSVREKAKELFDQVGDSTYMDDHYSYAFIVSESEGLVCIACFDAGGKEDLGQIITLGATGEFTTPKLYPATLTPEQVLEQAKEDGAAGILVHYHDGTYAILKV